MTTSESDTEQSAAATLEGLRVVMVVANDVSVDSRVKRAAKTVAGAGAEVTVIGISKQGVPETFIQDGYNVRLLNVGNELRTAPIPRFGPVLRPSDDWLRRTIVAEREGFKNYQREVGSELGWLRRDYFEERKSRSDEANEIQRRRNDKAAANKTRLSRRLHDRRKRRLTQRLKVSEQRREERVKRSGRRIQRSLEKSQRRSHARVDRLTSQLLGNRGPRGRTAWRSALPVQRDLEAAFGPALDNCEADVIHAHDVHLLGVAARALGRAYMKGSTPNLIYDAHEYIRGLGTYRPSTVAAWTSLEAEYLKRAHGVIAVSPQLGELLTSDYDLETSPVIVMNVPEMGKDCNTDVRTAVGLGRGDPLIVYSGGIDPSRGTTDLVRALGLLDGMHLALVANTEGTYADSLRTIAVEGGYGDRLHFAAFVPSDEVASYISTADLAVHPMRAGPMNHEIALPNKLFEYMQAGLPVVVSSCRAMAELVDKTGIGLVCESENPVALASAVKRASDNHDEFRSRVSEAAHEYRWDVQARSIVDLYSKVSAS